MDLKEKIWERLVWSWRPKSRKEADDAIVKNFLHHWFPAKVSKESIGFSYSLWLGTISLVLFAILGVTGVFLMFLYIPSVERAYLTMKDLDFVISYGWFLRGVHRMAAHLMVVSVFFHMLRVFYTGAYKKGILGGNRPLNWIIGVILLILTLALSYSGYLLPWDQLAYWAMTIGANVANSVPIIGEKIKFFLIGGSIIEQNTLIRFYVLHCVFLPLIATFLIVYHLWRIRKDGGLASVEQVIQREKKEGTNPNPAKTYSLLGIAKGIEVSVLTSSRMEEEGLIESSPNLVKRILWVILITTLFTILLAIFIRMPLEAPANPAVAPNPAKAPWYFLWLQELIADTTFTIFGFTVNGGFVGGVLIPGILILWLAIWPFMDKTSQVVCGKWLPKERLRQNLIFSLVVLGILVFLFIGAICRGPNWDFYWPWQKWPEIPTKF